METLLPLVQEWSALLGVAALIVVIINMGKVVGLINPADAPKWSMGLNLIGLGILFALKIFVPDANVSGMDEQIGMFAQVATTVFAYVMQLGGSKLFYEGLKGVPFIGKAEPK